MALDIFLQHLRYYTRILKALLPFTHESQEIKRIYITSLLRVEIESVTTEYMSDS